MLKSRDRDIIGPSDPSGSDPTTDAVAPAARCRRAGAWIFLLLVAALAGAALGCASTGMSISKTSFDRADLRELSETYSSAYSFLKAHGRVEIVRPTGLRPGDERLLVYSRGISSLNIPGAAQSALYVNDREVPDPVQYLRNLSLSDVRTLRILRASEASARYGGHGRQGAVTITLLR